MSSVSFHKLVRDRIPEIIEADGKTCVCETLSDEDYIYLLDQKLNTKRVNPWRNWLTCWRSYRLS